MSKLNEQAPSKLIVEKYLVEIAQSHKVQYKPDPNLAIQDYEYFYNFNHLEQPKNNNNNNTGGGGAGGGLGAGPSQAASAFNVVPVSISCPSFLPVISQVKKKLITGISFAPKGWGVNFWVL